MRKWLETITKETVIKKYQFIFLLLSIGVASCNKEITPLEIVQKSVEAHGDMEEWENVKTFSFTKKAVIYNTNGSVNKQVVQDQFFKFRDGRYAFINSRIDSVSYKQVGENIYKRKIDSVYELSGNELEKIENLFSSALYVVSQPFQLIKSKATFERIQDTLVNNKKVYALDVHYKDDSENSDQWTYYFEKNTFKVAACRVKHNKKVSIIENTSYDSSTPFLFNATRKSTIIGNENTSFVIAEYAYSNYKVTF